MWPEQQMSALEVSKAAHGIGFVLFAGRMRSIRLSITRRFSLNHHQCLSSSSTNRRASMPCANRASWNCSLA